MGAFKTGFHIGVCCEDMDTAIAFMSSVFNEPEHKRLSIYGVEFKYDNGDFIEWIKPTENTRGKKFDFIFCEDMELNEMNEQFRMNILKPMLVSLNIKMIHMADVFNNMGDKENKFTLVR
jgi:hypothetical protein